MSTQSIALKTFLHGDKEGQFQNVSQRWRLHMKSDTIYIPNQLGSTYGRDKSNTIRFTGK